MNYRSTNSFKKQRGVTSMEITISIALMVAATFIGFPYMIDIANAKRNEVAWSHLRQAIIKIRTNHGQSGSNYQHANTQELASSLPDHKYFEPQGAGDATTIVHALGGEGEASASLKPAQVLYAGDAAKITITGTDKSACEKAPWVMFAITESIVINDKTVKPVNGPIDHNAAQVVCKSDETNQIEVVFR